ncbi:nitrilase-related carbon-nitrogen hydrolase [Flavihumibacter fluvii]|uniref:nitrilase-related carbon-nitrogen hydrolase n=1 Tax=Flavihumibacter fluvii TaxID=2838157 RepID=UPI001BDF1F68|nr:nitrilase-related carbon-nitrogen hydrolase [Flavihumibacter fluvii]ULQ54623.1 hypothetical protein KJS93_09860 [Flavihumibacter fluvii]
MKFLRIATMALLALLILWWAWSKAGRVDDSPLPSDTPAVPITVSSFGRADSADGNIIGMQPFLTAKNYANEAGFYRELAIYMTEAKQKGLLSDKTIVVFPEYIGSWLVAANEKTRVYDPSLSMTDALTLQVSSNLLQFIPAYLKSKSADKTKEAIFRMKQPEIGRIYQSVFSRLAREYGVTIVAGSAVLASPGISADGKIETGSGKLYNTSAVFAADGKVQSPLIRKIFPITDEQGFTCAADTAQSPVFSTPAGRLAVLVCADSWFPAAYQNLNDKADVIAIPSLGGVDSIWTASWNGYSGFPPPADVDTTGDYHHITEGDAWAKYAMARRAPAVGIHHGMNVFFTGKLWDMHPEGRVLILENDSLHVSSPAVQQGRITNLWFTRNK